MAGLPEPWGMASAADDGQRWGPVELQALSFGRGGMLDNNSGDVGWWKPRIAKMNSVRCGSDTAA